MSAQAGVAYVDIRGRFDSLNAGVQTALSGLAGKFGAFGAVAASGIAVAVGAVGAVGIGLFKIGESFDEAYDKIRIGTGKTGRELAGLEADFRRVVSSVPTDFGAASTAVADLNQRLGLTGVPLQHVSERVLEASRLLKEDLGTNTVAVSQMFNNWGITTDDMNERLDQLWRASQRSGVGFGQLSSEMAAGGAVFRTAGLSFEESAGFLALLDKNGISAGPVMMSLGRAIKTATDEGRPAADVFRETFDAIKAAPDVTAAAGAAIDVFGARAGPKLAALIRDGKLSYEDFAAALSKGDTILKAGRDTNDLGEKLTILKNKVLVKLAPIATAVFDVVGKAVDGLLPHVDELMAAGQDLVDDVRRSWPQIKAAVGDVVTAIEVIWARFGDRILNVARTVFDLVKSQVMGFFNVLRGIFDIFAGILQGDWSRVWDGLQAVVAGVWQGIIGIVDFAWAQLQLVFSVAGAILGGIWNGIWAGISGAASAVWGVIVSGWSAITGFLLGIVNGFAGAFSGAWSGLWNGLVDVVNAVVVPIIGAFRWIVQGVKDVWNAFADTWNSFEIPSVHIGTPLGDIDIGGGGLPQLPRLHTGGIVPGVPGAEVPILAKSGEGVFTPDQMAAMGLLGAATGAMTGGGQTIVIQGDVYGFDDFKRKVGVATVELRREKAGGF